MHRAELPGAMTMAIECSFTRDDVVLNDKPPFHFAQLPPVSP